MSSASLQLVLGGTPATPSPAEAVVEGGGPPASLLALVRAMARADAERDHAAEEADSTIRESGVTVRP